MLIDDAIAMLGKRQFPRRASWIRGTFLYRAGDNSIRVYASLAEHHSDWRPYYGDFVATDWEEYIDQPRPDKA